MTVPRLPREDVSETVTIAGCSSVSSTSAIQASLKVSPCISQTLCRMQQAATI